MDHLYICFAAADYLSVREVFMYRPGIEKTVSLSLDFSLVENIGTLHQFIPEFSCAEAFRVAHRFFLYRVSHYLCTGKKVIAPHMINMVMGIQKDINGIRPGLCQDAPACAVYHKPDIIFNKHTVAGGKTLFGEKY